MCFQTSLNGPFSHPPPISPVNHLYVYARRRQMGCSPEPNGYCKYRPLQIERKTLRQCTLGTTSQGWDSRRESFIFMEDDRFARGNILQSFLETQKILCQHPCKQISDRAYRPQLTYASTLGVLYFDWKVVL